MSEGGGIAHLLERAAARWPRRTALVGEAGATIGYGELAALASAVRRRLRSAGVGEGDRVAICLPKSFDAVAAIFGVLETNAAYVPLDPTAPAARNATIVRDASPKAAIVSSDWGEALRNALPHDVVVVEGARDGSALRRALGGSSEDGAPVVSGDPEGLAYILYTSGSTGTPKGVMISHRAAASFVDWAAATFAPTADDRFSSHAPFHFDLSVFDLFVAIRHGASVVLIPDSVGKEPLRLADWIAEREISIWYSVPSVLMLLARYGKLARHRYPTLRLVLFAGEVFPVPHLRALRALWPAPRYFNLYGPTETNVCTCFEIPPTIAESRDAPYPIGRPCAHVRANVIDAQGAAAPAGTLGELCVAGAPLMRGYWNRPEETAKAFFESPPGERWYRTGDLVVENGDGDYEFAGRRDRMVKRRGYRVELDEVEAGLHRHPDVAEAAVVAVADGEDGVRLRAFLTFPRPPRPSLVELKRFCAEVLPAYMIPDFFEFPEKLPRTSTGKVDYPRLADAAGRR